jgi:hypothetical protein
MAEALFLIGIGFTIACVLFKRRVRLAVNNWGWGTVEWYRNITDARGGFV